MKKYFVTSLIKGGILGGGLTADDEKICYKTGKLTVAPELRNIVIPYKNIKNITKGGFFIFKTYKFTLENNKEYKFLVFTANALDKILKSKTALKSF